MLILISNWLNGLVLLPLRVSSRYGDIKCYKSQIKIRITFYTAITDSGCLFLKKRGGGGRYILIFNIDHYRFLDFNFVLFITILFLIPHQVVFSK